MEEGSNTNRIHNIHTINGTDNDTDDDDDDNWDWEEGEEEEENPDEKTTTKDKLNRQPQDERTSTTKLPPWRKQQQQQRQIEEATAAATANLVQRQPQKGEKVVAAEDARKQTRPTRGTIHPTPYSNTPNNTRTFLAQVQQQYHQQYTRHFPVRYRGPCRWGGGGRSSSSSSSFLTKVFVFLLLFSILTLIALHRHATPSSFEYPQLPSNHNNHNNNNINNSNNNKHQEAQVQQSSVTSLNIQPTEVLRREEHQEASSGGGGVRPTNEVVDSSHAALGTPVATPTQEEEPHDNSFNHTTTVAPVLLQPRYVPVFEEYFFEEDTTRNSSQKNRSRTMTKKKLHLQIPGIDDSQSISYLQKYVGKGPERKKELQKVCTYQPLLGWFEKPKLIKARSRSSSAYYYQAYNTILPNTDNITTTTMTRPREEQNEQTNEDRAEQPYSFDYVHANYDRINNEAALDLLPPGDAPGAARSVEPDNKTTTEEDEEEVTVLSNDEEEDSRSMDTNSSDSLWDVFVNTSRREANELTAAAANPSSPISLTLIPERPSSPTGQPMVYTAAVCQVRPSMKPIHLSHFAHAMEEIYKCFNYWVEYTNFDWNDTEDDNNTSNNSAYHNNNDSKSNTRNTTDNAAGSNSTTKHEYYTPIMIYDEKQRYFLQLGINTNPFLNGMFEMLTEYFNLQTMTTNEYYYGRSDKKYVPVTRDELLIVAKTSNTTTSNETKGDSNDKNEAVKAADFAKDVERRHLLYYHANQTVRTFRTLGENGYIMRYSYEWNQLIDRYLIGLNTNKEASTQKRAVDMEDSQLTKLTQLRQQEPEAKGKAEGVIVAKEPREQISNTTDDIILSSIGSSLSTISSNNTDAIIEIKTGSSNNSHCKDVQTKFGIYLKPNSVRSRRENCTWVGMDPITRCDLLLKDHEKQQGKDKCPETCHIICPGQPDNVGIPAASHGRRLSASNTVINKDMPGKSSNSTTATRSISHTNNDDYDRPPRIAILNRKRNRKIWNTFELSLQLSKIVYILFTGGSGSGNSSTTTLRNLVDVTYLEGKQFHEQIQFFRDTDILIAPHGAGLTGIVFMGNDYLRRPPATRGSSSSGGSKSCKQIMELYPKNYALPYYFGSLAVQSGIGHSYVYYDDGIPIPIEPLSMLSNSNNTQQSEENKGKPRHDTTNNITSEDGSTTNTKHHRRRLLENSSSSMSNKNSGRRPNPPREVMPWERINPVDYKQRRAARSSQFCPRRLDMTNMVVELIVDWYKCRNHRRRQAQQQQQNNDDENMDNSNDPTPRGPPKEVVELLFSSSENTNNTDNKNNVDDIPGDSRSGTGKYIAATIATNISVDHYNNNDASLEGYKEESAQQCPLAILNKAKNTLERNPNCPGSTPFMVTKPLDTTKQITFFLIYFNDHHHLAHQIDSWSKFSKNALQEIQFVIVDDGSAPGHTAIEFLEANRALAKPLDIVIYKIDQNLVWNIGGARNLGFWMANTPWVFMSDGDIRVQPETMDYVVNIKNQQYQNSTSNNVFVLFQRLRDNKKTLKPHPAVMLVRKVDYWLAGGCDEDFVGHYGQTDPHFRYRVDKHPALNLVETHKLMKKDHVPPLLELEDNIGCPEGITTCLTSFKGEKPSRDTKPNYDLLQKKIAAGNWSNEFLRFTWKQMVINWH